MEFLGGGERAETVQECRKQELTIRLLALSGFATLCRRRDGDILR